MKKLLLTFVLGLIIGTSFCKNKLYLVASPQRYPVADIDHIWISKSKSKLNSFSIRGENFTRPSGRFATIRTRAIGKLVRIFGQGPSSLYTNHPIYGRKDIKAIQLPCEFGTYFIKIRYSKDGPVNGSVKMYLNDNEVGQFIPQNQNRPGQRPGDGWNIFTETPWIKLEILMPEFEVTHNLPDSIPAIGGEYEYHVKWNRNFDESNCIPAHKTSSKPAWIDNNYVKYTNYFKGKIIVKENTFTSPRMEDLVLNLLYEKGGASIKTIPIHIAQKGKCKLEITNHIPTPAPFWQESYMVNVGLRKGCDCEWSAKVQQGKSWLSLDNNSQNNESKQIKATLKHNKDGRVRYGVLKFENSCEDRNRTFIIVQEREPNAGFSYALDTENINFPNSFPQSVVGIPPINSPVYFFRVKITPKVVNPSYPAPAWSISQKPNWLNISPTSGSSGQVVSVRVMDNNSANPRIGEILIEARNADNSPQTITIEQKPLAAQAGNIIEFFVNGQRYGEIDLDHFWLSNAPCAKEIYFERKCEDPDSSTVGSNIFRGSAIGKRVFGQVGTWPSHGYPALRGKVIYKDIPGKGKKYIKFRYSKYTSSKPISIIVNRKDTITFSPLNTGGWNNFLETNWMEIKFSDDTTPLIGCNKSQNNNPDLIPIGKTRKSLGPSLSIYPNPFSRYSILTYSVSEDTNVNISIYNIQGKQIRSLIDDTKPKGSYSIRWDGKIDSGTDASKGLYILKFIHGNQQILRKLILQ